MLTAAAVCYGNWITVSGGGQDKKDENGFLPFHAFINYRGGVYDNVSWIEVLIPGWIICHP